MPEIGSRWKFKNAQVDFTMRRVDENIVYCTMNWPEKEDKAMIRVSYEYGFDQNGRPCIKEVRRNPYDEFQVKLQSFEDGSVTRSEAD